MKIKILVLFLLAGVLALPANGQEKPVSAELSGLFSRQRQLFPQEKTHLHMDRNHYIPGDTVWFCGYAVDASTHLPDTLSRYLYVDLQNPDGTFAQRIKALSQNGAFPGYLALPDDMPAGNYTVSAYTLFMAGSDAGYFFRRPIRISAPPSVQARPDNPSGHRALPANRNASENDAGLPVGFDVSFFPEGGHLLSGGMSVVGVKALKPDGLAENITGTLFDSAGNPVVVFETFYKGMGSFAFIPETGNGYYAVCENEQGVSRRFDLPEPRNDAFALRAVRRGERLFVTVGAPSGSIPDRNLTLVLQSRGVVQHVQAIENASNPLVFDATKWPSGVNHLLLLDENLRTLSERLVFHLNETEQPRVALALDKPAYGRRERVRSTVSVRDADGESLSGTFSVAVTDDRDILPDTAHHILTELLLSSELKGYVESPAWYFSGDEPFRRQALDALMLTQGWRRYDVPALLRGDFQEVEAMLEVSQEVSGRVKALASSNPSVGTPVHMLAPDTGHFWTTETDEEGRFSFSGFDYPDSTTFVIRAVSKRGNDRVVLTLDAESTAEVVHPPIPLPIPHVHRGSEPGPSRDSLFIAKADQKWTLENGMRTIHLDEVAVRGSARPAFGPSFFSGMGKLYDQDFIKKHGINHVDQLFSRLSRVRANPEGELEIQIMRSPPARLDWIPATVMVNSTIPEEDFRIWDISMGEIESIEVITNPVATMGTMNVGVIVIATKSKREPLGEIALNRKSVTLQGYQSPAEFYSPRYETTADRNRSKPDLRTTVHWAPGLHTAADAPAVFDFYTADGLPTTYSVVIEGLTSDGRIVRAVEKITCQ